MGQLKWKRQEPGVYTSGTYRVEGTVTNWDLHEGKKHLHSGKSKKECQGIAEDGGVAPGVDLENLHEHAPRKQSKGEIEGTIASLRLEVENLMWRISSLDTTINKLTDAILILGKHVGKLGKK